MTDELGPVQYFEVENKAGQIILTPVRIQRGDALRAKLAELKIDAKTIESALAWPAPAASNKSGKPRAAKKAAAKPLRPVSLAGRNQAAATTTDLKASLSRALAQVVKR
ncbi:hypothetical protein LNV09_01080 [Paucibacter sp. B2R-40]|uniref:hypothetical protein n=1 Tax=Paucibacter sp. B2R-40 TaxID=2893554 RepID=UPI0021E38173|nr:hypothetical protein [Paucibacter sp. B2R-40]MCV2352747.1 hypothetical protein [Paucibacter sp. B2R-40]